jgi:acyl-CoA synthetase (AMP-forming)/AMP-acid ligase II
MFDPFEVFMKEHLLSIFEYNRALMPDKPLYVRVAKDGSVSDSVTFGQMSRLIASYSRFIDGRIERGAKVVLLYPSSFEFIPAFLGCLHRGVLPMAFQVPNSEFKFARMIALMRGNGIRHVMLSGTVMERSWFKRLLETDCESFGFEWIVDDSRRPQPVYEPLLSVEDVEAPIYHQLSSGSTGEQKAIPISASNVYHNTRSIGRSIRQHPDVRHLCWLPHYHDLGLVAGLFLPMVYGNVGYLMEPFDFIARPAMWFEAISKYRVNFTHLPNFALDICTRRVDPGGLPSGTDLASLQSVMVCAEPIRETSLNAFRDRFSSIGFRADGFVTCYGLAECTLAATMLDPFSPVRSASPEEGAQAYVSCGKPIEGVSVEIQTEDGGPGPIGEVVLSGSSVSAFFKDGRLRTGDLGFMDGGELFITGRKKELIILNGVKYLLHELEHIAEALPFVHERGSLACIDRSARREELVMLVELKRQHLSSLDLDLYTRRLNAAFNRELGISVRKTHFFAPATLPKTSSGKKFRGDWSRLLENSISRSEPCTHGD